MFALLLLGLAGWLMMRPRSEGVGHFPVEKSSRIRLTGMVSKGLERPQTLREWEREAASMDEAALWGGLERSSWRWMDEAALRPWSTRPSNQIVMLAREIGRRRGKEGVLEIAALLGKFEKLFPQDKEDQRANLKKLSVSLRYGAFGGWSGADPAEAIRWIVEGIPYPRTRLASHREEIPLDFANPMVIRGSRFEAAEVLAGERVLRSAFARLSQEDPAEATNLLVAGTRSLLFDPNQLVEAILPVLNDPQRRALFDRLAIQSRGHQLFSRNFWDGSLEFSWKAENGMEKSRLAEVLVRTNRGKALDMARDGNVPSDVRGGLVTWLARTDSRSVALSNELSSSEELHELISFSANVSSLSFGPIDGRDGGVYDDLVAHYKAVGKAVSLSRLDPDLKTKLLSRIEQKATGP